MRQRFITGFIVVALSVALFMPSPAHAAGSIFLAPNAGTYGVGSTITMRVVVGTGGQAINSAQATISYNTSLLDVTSVNRNGSIFTLWPSEPSAANGVITFSGGLPTPGYTGNGGLLITVTFRAKAVGTATNRVVSGRVLLNDGLGTDILTGYGQATYTINQSPPTVTPGSVLPAPTISSSSHPDQTVWYPLTTIIVAWEKAAGALDFSYEYDDQPGTTPDGTADTTETSLTLEDTSDGVAYFHLRARNENGWSDAAHYKIQIDSTKPEEFVIRLEGENPTGIRSPKIHFETTDAASAVVEYQVIIDSAEPLTVKVGDSLPFTLPELSLGDHRITVKAIDAAGNSRDASIDIMVIERDSDIEQVTKVITSYALLFFAVTLLILMLISSIFVLIISHKGHAKTFEDYDRLRQRLWPQPDPIKSKKDRR